MPIKAKELIPALQEACHLARLHRTPAAIVFENGALKAVLRPSKNDRVVISDINPPLGDIKVFDAVQLALHEFEDAKPALERFFDIVDKDGAGRPRASSFKTEMLAAFLDAYEDGEDVDHMMTNTRYPPEPVSLWTRIREFKIW